MLHKNSAERSGVVINQAETPLDEETELVIAQRLLACILARRLDDIQLSETEDEEHFAIHIKKKE